MKISDMVPVGWHKEDLLGPDGRLHVWQSEVTRLLNEISHSMLTFVPARPGWWSSYAGVMPHVNVYAGDNEVEVTAELPGIEEKDVEISFSYNLLSIKGSRKAEREMKRKGYYRMEQSYGSFQRDIPIPFDIDRDKMKATFKNGVLSVILPKNHKDKEGGTKIHIKTE